MIWIRREHALERTGSTVEPQDLAAAAAVPSRHIEIPAGAEREAELRKKRRLGVKRGEWAERRAGLLIQLDDAIRPAGEHQETLCVRGPWGESADRQRQDRAPNKPHLRLR